MQDIAQSTYDFGVMRANRSVYVDKTAMLHALIKRDRDAFYFISRPRRFGKSLMLSTLKYLFQGRRDLFKGLAIDALDYDWAEYPVISLDFYTAIAPTLETFKANLRVLVRSALLAAGADWDDAATPEANFGVAIDTLAERRGKPVVVLIDEYDAPVSHAVDDIARANAIRESLSAIYAQLKSHNANIRFMMMTGVTKFTQLSVFSALNNLVDLTLQPEAATLLGYTEEELDQYFGEHLRAHAKVMGLSNEDYRGQLRWWYNGYRFSPDSETKVYNPVAIGRALSRRKAYFEPTWSETGHSTALMKYLAAHPLTSRDYECIPEVERAVFDVYDLDNIGYLTFLYQGGYLTIKDFDPISGYTLGIPDEDVRQDLNQILVDQALKEDNDSGWNKAKISLLKYDFPTFFTCLKSFYARLTYGAKEDRVSEASYQRSLFVLLTAGGLRAVSEDTQAQGRADLVADAFGRVFIFELKVGGTAEEALAQIRDRHYDLPYLASAQTIHRIGLVFDPKTHQLLDTAVEPVR